MDWENKIHLGHCIDVLKTLPDKSVDCCITSPPYWSLRNYETEPSIFGGESKCNHSWQPIKRKHIFAYNPSIVNIPEQTCSQCGAWMGELGSESDFNLYIEHLCMVFDEVYRTLKDEGSCWVNIGDTYGRRTFLNPNSGENRCNYKKSLLLLPHRFAIAMSDRGWIVRNVIIWQKTNCIPSSAKDRFTNDFEYMFFFVKSPKYYFEQQIEPFKESSIKRCQSGCNNNKGTFYQGLSKENFERFEQKVLNGEVKGKNKRAIWTIPSAVCKEAHFATYPPKLVETPIKAGCPKGGIVLDPFVGSGTTAIVAENLGRQWVGIELNPNYKKIAEEKIGKNRLKNAV